MTREPAVKGDLKKQLSIIRRSMHEWMAFVVFLATHAGHGWEAIPLPVTGWTNTIITWLSGERVGTLIDFHLPRVTWPNVQELYLHGANPRYLWHFGLEKPELAVLNPRELGAREIAAVSRERDKRLRKWEKNAENLKHRTNELLRKDRIRKISEVRRWHEQMDSEDPSTRVYIAAKRVKDGEYMGCAVRLNHPEPGDGTVFVDITDFRATKELPGEWEMIPLPAYDQDEEDEFIEPIYGKNIGPMRPPAEPSTSPVAEPRVSPSTGKGKQKALAEPPSPVRESDTDVEHQLHQEEVDVQAAIRVSLQTLHHRPGQIQFCEEG
ncbi:hypothetical protein FA95DRAFT_1614064 [Auriscalpium vulgare]|uniref:Uncharacterized protein n=1 Tax=Auriscalpium vulgare TaxID=40419 RepID=A0ACB8R0K1_9AGAM|nr:hypothetical protein FA95DRAFT_1614064 [Auriscalpium vulgare]